jgi:predicted DsbA family dithiol-disulfide isomerase
LKELLETDREVEAVWRAYELRPEPVPTLDPAGDYIQKAWQRSVFPLAGRIGRTMNLPPIQPRSRRAHETAHWARSIGRFDSIHEAIFRAFFERGEDISSIPTLVAIAASTGADGDELAAALEQKRFESSVLEDENLAESFGLRGVPAFVADRAYAATGVQSVEALRELIATARQHPRDR